MTIYINGRFACQPQSGVQRYASEIVRALDRKARPGQFVLLSPSNAPDAALARIEQRRVGGPGGHAWDQGAFAVASRRGVALSLAMSAPLLHARQVVVLHDAAVHRHPAHFGRLYGAGHRTMERWLARRARIATVSAFSRMELSSALGICPETILVAPNGADHRRCERDDTVLGRLGLARGRFFLMIGNASLNKNVAVAIRAIERLAERDVRLVLVGSHSRGVTGAPVAPSRRVIVAGRLRDGEIAGLLGSAAALVFASRYEGFGLPLIEAMAAGCPVLASDCAAALEVCAGAANHFGVDDDEALVGLMACALANPGEWRETRVAAGSRRAKAYRWADSARILAAACAELERGA